MCQQIKCTIIFFCMLGCLSFVKKEEIGDCYISFTNASHLTATPPDRLPETAEKFRVLKVDTGEVKITRIDGYRVLYNNEKNAPFINLKIEVSENGHYEADQKLLIENLKYLNTHSVGMESKELLELKFNGYKILGLSRSGIETGSTLGTFVMFPGNGVTIYFYFNNIKPEFRQFDNVDDYKKQRNRFIDEYTKYLRVCLSK